MVCALKKKRENKRALPFVLTYGKLKKRKRETGRRKVYNRRTNL